LVAPEMDSTTAEDSAEEYISNDVYSCSASEEEEEEGDVLSSDKQVKELDEEDSISEGSAMGSEGSPESKDAPPCEFCGQVPCDVITFWDDICEICDDLKDSGLANNQVRFQAYKEYTRLKHGVL